LIRREDWPERLLAYVEAQRDKPFAWGENDCALFTADGILAMTDVDLAAEVRGRYTTAIGAFKILRTSGVEDLTEWLTRALGEPILPALARRGDVVMSEGVTGPVLGLVLGQQAAAAGPAGVTLVPSARWQQAWRV
jgi:hypothetical protein